MNTIMKAGGICRVFPQEGVDVQALADVNLELFENDFTAIMGASGSGKSTLLYVLSGLDKPSSGQVQFGGKRIDSLSEKAIAILRRKAFGFVFQSINLVQNLSIEENILVAGYLLKTSRAEVRERCRELLTAFGLAELSHRLPSQLSGGEQQRAAIARALINKPAILFADEPTGALNFANGQKVLDHLNAANDLGQTVVLVTHDMKTASRAKRIVLMRDGQVVDDFRFPDSLKDIASCLADREKALFAWLSERGL